MCSLGGESTRSLRNTASRSAPSSSLEALAAGGKARTTTSVPAARSGRRSRIRCRSRRVTRCRTTALPTALLTTKPTRDGSPCSRVGAADVGRLLGCPPCRVVSAGSPAGAADSGRSTCATRRDRPARRPRRTTRLKSWLLVRRAAAGRTTPVRQSARGGPCDDERPRWRGQPGCACAAGTRASSPVCGCSAGRCACPCSRSDLPVTSGTMASKGHDGSVRCPRPQIAAAFAARMVGREGCVANDTDRCVTTALENKQESSAATCPLVKRGTV